jgi:hypothetical protein
MCQAVILVWAQYTIFYLETDNACAYNEKHENQLIQILTWKMINRLRITIKFYSLYRIFVTCSALEWYDLS